MMSGSIPCPPCPLPHDHTVNYYHDDTHSIMSTSPIPPHPMSADGIIKYRRQAKQRVFVNRSLRMEKIKLIGFDMDYTIAEYVSPAFEKLAFDHIIERLIDVGYPDDFRKLEYVPHFPVRGLWFDMEFGNLLKCDAYGNILVGVHGRRYMSHAEIEAVYPNKFMHLTETRIYVLNTLFNVPETHLLADIVNYFDNAPDYTVAPDGRSVTRGEERLSYRAIFQDVRQAVDWVHIYGTLKKETVANMDKYVVKDERLGQMLQRLGTHSKLFLLTNSDWWYSNNIMTFLLGAEWRNIFDLVVVDARKPLWFAEGTVFRQVDIATGSLKIGMHTGVLKKGQVYSGGSCDVFTKLVRARGKDVLYVGDHIFGDVLRSKKARGWRTMLIVPELDQTLRVWTEKYELFDQLQALDIVMGDMYKDLDSSSEHVPNTTKVTHAIRKVTHEMDQQYGMLGSLFRSGNRSTFFASQVERYADLYSSSCCNLLYYPHTYFFRAPPMLLPHESTVAQGGAGGFQSQLSIEAKATAQSAPSLDSVVESALAVVEKYQTADRAKADAASTIASGRYERARTPRQPTYVHEDDQEGECCTGTSNSSDDKSQSPTPFRSRQHADSETQLDNLTRLSGTEDVITMGKGHCDPEC